MQTFRGSLAHIPNTISNIIHSASANASTIDGSAISSCEVQGTEENSMTPTSMSGDDASDKSHAIPSSLIKEEWQLVLDQDATVVHLSNAIERCKELVLNTDECTEERKWLVRHLVELRFRLREMEDAINDSSKLGSNYKV